MSELKTCFKKVDYDLSGLLHYIDIWDIALPDTTHSSLIGVSAWQPLSGVALNR